jgi:NADH-quinone oxidoreductase subunit A
VKAFTNGPRLASETLVMVTQFTPVFIIILFAIFGIAAGMLGMSAALGPRKKTAVKQMPYESGMDPIGDARQRFDVRYYLVAIMFLLFDVELLFLYPWAVAQYSATPAVETASGMAPAAIPGVPPVFRGMVFVEIMVFIAVLMAAYAYAWKKGVFEWR